MHNKFFTGHKYQSLFLSLSCFFNNLHKEVMFNEFTASLFFRKFIVFLFFRKKLLLFVRLHKSYKSVINQMFFFVELRTQFIFFFLRREEKKKKNESWTKLKKTSFMSMEREAETLQIIHNFMYRLYIILMYTHCSWNG